MAEPRPAAARAFDETVPRTVREARRAQRAWAKAPLRERLEIVRRFRGLLAERGEELIAAAAGVPGRTEADTLTAEVLPLAEACRFLERRAPELLAPRRLPTALAPLWLLGNRVELRREPLGVVLVIGPSNYPLFLPGVQALQALAAGNAVLLKPGRGGHRAASTLAALLTEAGLDASLCAVLGEAEEEGRAAIGEGVDKVLLTGSAATGRSVLADLAPRLTPATVELSGCDALFVLDGADLDLVARAASFGLRLNGGATCIAPRRLFAGARQLTGLRPLLRRHLAPGPPVPLRPDVAARAHALIEQALRDGARPVLGGLPMRAGMAPLVLAGVRPEMAIARADLFAPVLSLIEVDGAEEALAADARCPYALGASIFGPRAAAEELARRVEAGVVVVNDLIVPTADPRLPFGGRGESGYGSTRGAEGLLELTRTKAIATRRAGWRPHLGPQPAGAKELFLAYLQARHGGTLTTRMRGLAALPRGGRRPTGRLDHATARTD